jgi:hypothetical protein
MPSNRKRKLRNKVHSLGEAFVQYFAMGWWMDGTEGCDELSALWEAHDWQGLNEIYQAHKSEVMEFCQCLKKHLSEPRFESVIKQYGLQV